MGALARGTDLSSELDRASQRQDELLGVVDDRLGGEANDTDATGLENSCSPPVLPRSVSMDGAIDFDGKLERRTVEVDDESSDDVLAPELEARELAFA